jgi:hypothetical protein
MNNGLMTGPWDETVSWIDLSDAIALQRVHRELGIQHALLAVIA